MSDNDRTDAFNALMLMIDALERFRRAGWDDSVDCQIDRIIEMKKKLEECKRENLSGT